MPDFPEPNVPETLSYATPVAGARGLHEVAVRQRAIMLCILGYLLFIVLLVLTFIYVRDILLVRVLLVCIFGTIVTGAVFVFRLSLAVYGIAAGIVLGILTLVPYLGIIPLLIVNQKATKVLRKHGIRVGLLGANPALVPRDIIN